MNQRERQIFDIILLHEIAKESDSLLPEAEEIINTYKEPLSDLKKSQMHSLVNIAQNTDSIGNVVNYIRHQTGRHEKTWGKKIGDKTFGKAIDEKITSVVDLAQGIFNSSFDKMQNILKDQNKQEATKEQDKEEATRDRRIKTDILQYIKISLIRKFIQHLSAYYEVRGIRNGF